MELSPFYLLVVPLLLYIYTVTVVSTRFPMLKNKRIVLLIAHPDDEAMFFSPTLLALTRPATGNHVKILCLSTGDADGLGQTRKQELVKSGMKLGLRKEEDVLVIDDTDQFPDSMTTPWTRDSISTFLTSAFAPSAAKSKSKPSSPPKPTIDVLITFDSQGVSGHINHRSLYHGATTFLQSLQSPGHANPLSLYVLSSVNMVRKYSGLLDMAMTLLKFGFATVSREGEGREKPSSLVFANNYTPDEYGKAFGAMTQAHKSQMVWFRYGWILTSRYMLVNDLRLVKPTKGGKEI